MMSFAFRPISDQPRNQDLDVIKGCLVVVMIIYHNASAERGPELERVTNAIPFVHSAFLEITGFLCGYHYWPRVRQNRAAVVKRLLNRAVKVAFLFTVCNVALNVAGLGPGWDKISVVLANWRSCLERCVVGISGDYFAFEVLVYITEFLCLAALIARCYLIAHVLLTAAIFLGIVMGGDTPLFLACGALGMMVGIAASGGGLRRYDRFLRRAWVLLLVPVAVDVVIRSRHGFRLPNVAELPLRSVETLLWFYVFLGSFGRWRWGIRHLTIVGRYTLFAYLFQMALVKVLVVLGGQSGMPEWLRYSCCVILVTVATYCAIIVLNGLRQYRMADRCYTLVFG